MTNSVALATYNGSKFVLELLNSIVNQTKKIDEVIIVDDRSTDDTVEKIKNFITENKLENTFKIFVNEQNLGYAENFRKALSLCTGDVIFLADQDDVWVNDRLEKMSSVMANNSEIGLLNTDFAWFSEDINKLDGYYESEKLEIKNIPLNAKNRFLKFPGCVMCLRKDFYEKIEKYWYKGWAHDEFLWCVSVLFGKCYYYKYCSLKRRSHEEQASGRVGKSKENRIKYLKSEILCAEKLIEIAKETGFSEKIIKLFKENKVTTEQRLSLVQDKKIGKIFSLLFRLKYYSSKRAYFREFIIGIKK